MRKTTTTTHLDNKVSHLEATNVVKLTSCLHLHRQDDHQESFRKGIQNAHNLLNMLERSIHKTNKYEARLLQCKSKHVHAHLSNEDCCEGKLTVKESVSSKAEKLLSNPINLAESWSTMNIACLQYQYEELCIRFKSLLQAYDERCTMLQDRDVSIQQLRESLSRAHEQLVSTHETLLSVGEKYLSLRCRKLVQKCWYENRIRRLRQKLREMLAAVEQAQLSLDNQLSRSPTNEHDAAVTLLLAEIKKCNILFLENIKLKIEIEELISK